MNRASSGVPFMTERWFCMYIPVYRQARWPHGAALAQWLAKRTPLAANASMLGVSTTGCPMHERPSPRHWSTVMNKTLRPKAFLANSCSRGPGDRCVPRPRPLASAATIGTHEPRATARLPAGPPRLYRHGGDGHERRRDRHGRLQVGAGSRRPWRRAVRAGHEVRPGHDGALESRRFQRLARRRRVGRPGRGRFRLLDPAGHKRRPGKGDPRGSGGHGRVASRAASRCA